MSLDNGNEASRSSWYFTSPFEPVAIRRGDALGFRAGADWFADLIAPGLSNNTIDARWITILCWCLKWSHIAWESNGGGDLTTREGQRDRYAWLRPLELLWIARTLHSDQNKGQLRGIRSVKRWLELKSSMRELSTFGMSPEQFRRYRQVGMYGAYRVILRASPELTVGDGWTPAPTARRLAQLVNQSLPTDVRLKEGTIEAQLSRRSRKRDEEWKYWVKHGWPQALDAIGGLVPTEDVQKGTPLTPDEIDLLSPTLFASGSIRRTTVEVLKNARTANSHIELCNSLAGSNETDQSTEATCLIGAFPG